MSKDAEEFSSPTSSPRWDKIVTYRNDTTTFEEYEFNGSEVAVDNRDACNHAASMYEQHRKRKALFFQPSSKKPLDVSENARKYARAELYGTILTGQQVACFVCRYAPIGFGMQWEMAHVVPRVLDGNNDSIWNRIAVCPTCNRKVPQYSNLFDVLALDFPSRIVPVALFLKRCFWHSEPKLAQKYLKDVPLEQFVRLFYGQTSDIACEKELHDFLRAALPDLTKFNPQQRSGRIQNEKVYESLREYDALRAEQTAAQKKLDLLEADMRLQRHRMQEKLENLEAELSLQRRQLHEKTNEINFYWPDMTAAADAKNA